ncbi:MAG TPA: ABC transporter substrate-binding protein [Albitalea sp.]|uniref:ABC transporter substrate-binding protein n=1 Tax=Piscinibacter sp. TaxID=1903157 RepID=UPI002ED64E53
MRACAIRLLWALAIGLCLTAAVEAKTLRWAARGDTQSMDPHAVNEGVTNNINNLVYDFLVERDRDLNLVPALATGWTAVNDTTWRFALRRGVKFQDGTPLTADDVVFSIERAQQPTSQLSQFALPMGKPVRIDEQTVEFRLERPNPLMLEHAAAILIMSRAWCIAHRVDRVPAFNSHEEAFSSRNAMGTGPFMLKQREAGVRTVLVRNPQWWGRFEGNVTEVIFMPIGNDSTRVAALQSGGVDLIQDAPPQDLLRLSRDPSVRLTSGPENRVIFLGLDQFRDQLLYSSVKGRNPLKDRRVREAFFHAIDVHALKKSIMREQSVPTACMTVAARGCKPAAELEVHPPADVARARCLMADAGYADGFELTIDCPNDRYVNDQAICVALVGMLGRIGVTLRVDARPKSIFFPKVQNFDTSFYMYGWGGATIDPQLTMDPLMHSPDAKSQKGGDNNGRIADAELDRLIDAAAAEMNLEKRTQLLRDTLTRVHDQYYYLPLHRQMLTWLSRANVRPVILPSNQVRVAWIQID